MQHGKGLDEMKIILDPRLKFNYASWYLLGVYDVVRKGGVEYNVTPFRELKYEDNADLNAGMAMLVKDKERTCKVFIDFEDVAKIFDDRYVWCDVYAMVNPKKDQLEQYPKTMAIGPEFGITLTGRIGSVVQSVRRYWQGRKYNKIPYKLYLRDYLYSNIRRRKLSCYEEDVPVRDNYIFHASTLWYNEFAWTNTNMFRGEFLKACQKAELEIEGGLFYLGEGEAILREMPDYARYKTEYKDFIYEQRLSIDDYIRKTKESVVVFNTPAVCECHGWKLAEYLCMGKAIISSPLSRELPAPLVHGEHVHFVSSADEIYDAILRIKGDVEYRQRLERGARKYYEEWLAPKVVINRIVERGFSK